jgi:hypothetical protein
MAKTKPISKAKLAAAKKDYMEYRSPNSIALKHNIPRSSLLYHITRYWKPEREMAKAELFQAMTDSKRVDFTRITESAISIMSRALHELATRVKPPTVNEAKQASEILNILDRITRLDEGNPTDIQSNQEKPMTIEVIQEKLKNDPFLVEAPKGPKENEAN